MTASGRKPPFYDRQSNGTQTCAKQKKRIYAAATIVSSRSVGEQEMDRTNAYNAPAKGTTAVISRLGCVSTASIPRIKAAAASTRLCPNPGSSANSVRPSTATQAYCQGPIFVFSSTDSSITKVIEPRTGNDE